MTIEVEGTEVVDSLNYLKINKLLSNFPNNYKAYSLGISLIEK